MVKKDINLNFLIKMKLHSLDIGGAGAGAGIGTSVPDAGLEEVTNKVTNLEGRVDQLTRSVGDLDKENATMVLVGTQEF